MILLYCHTCEDLSHLMIKASEACTSIVHTTLMKSSIGSLLKMNSAIVLERIARGGDAVNWYYCRDESSLFDVEKMLSPGSVVSFYFDQRIRSHTIPLKSEPISREYSTGLATLQ